MSHNKKYFETIDKYLNSELNEAELSELEYNLRFNSDLVEEHDLQLDVQHAIQEQDIISLRESINQITSNQGTTCAGREPNTSNSFNFGLAEEITSTSNFQESVQMEDILEFTHSFPKVHLYQHLMAAKENIYQFYKEQQEEHSSKREKVSHSTMEDELFEEIQMAMQENDVLDLRANLKMIASSTARHTHTLIDIDSYMDQTMDGHQIAEFEEQLKMDKNLANDLQLYQEIDLAMTEPDIDNLRASIRQIQQASSPFNIGIKEIDGYIYNELTESELALFEDQLATNKNLYAELDLILNIDQAVKESDIMQLRNNLVNITKETIKEKQVERSITGKIKSRRTVISAVAASLIFLMGITGLLKYTSEDNIYQNFYNTYETAGITRSANSISDQTFALALQKYNDQDYESALGLLKEVISKDQNNMASHFYSAISLQELGKYKNAIEEYQVVVVDKDNLFIEQADWYIGLCFIQTKEEEKAIVQFKKIAIGRGFYQQRAQAILRKMRANL